jgi:hypothetical protein
VAYLRDKASEHADQSMALTMTGQSSRAASRAGAAQSTRDVISEILAKREPKEQPATDTTWSDPAARRSKRENIDV